MKENELTRKNSKRDKSVSQKQKEQFSVRWVWYGKRAISSSILFSSPKTVKRQKENKVKNNFQTGSLSKTLCHLVTSCSLSPD